MRKFMLMLGFAAVATTGLMADKCTNIYNWPTAGKCQTDVADACKELQGCAWDAANNTCIPKN